MCWVQHDGDLAYMVSHCWRKYGFAVMKANFPNSKVTVRFKDGTSKEVPLKELQYDSPCVMIPEVRDEKTA